MTSFSAWQGLQKEAAAIEAAELRLQADTTKKKNKAKRDFTKQLVKAIAEKRQSQKSPADEAAEGRKKLQS